jgi:hypothetical protein
MSPLAQRVRSAALGLACAHLQASTKNIHTCYTQSDQPNRKYTNHTDLIIAFLKERKNERTNDRRSVRGRHSDTDEHEGTIGEGNKKREIEKKNETQTTTKNECSKNIPL